MLSVTQHITSSFHVARSKYQSENRRWIDASGALAGRVGIMPMAVNIQRAGEIDLVLRAMEDEFLPGIPDEAFAVHYQLMLSESWILACYEFLRTIRQREDETARLARKRGEEPEVDAISRMIEFRALFEEMELLRIPIAKFEIAKDRAMKQPLVMSILDEGSQYEIVYDKTDPGRFHVMQGARSLGGRLGWQAIDHANSRVFWIERRALSDRLLECAAKVEPAGIREARLRAEAEQAMAADRGDSAPD